MDLQEFFRPSVEGAWLFCPFPPREARAKVVEAEPRRYDFFMLVRAMSLDGRLV